MQVSSGKSRTRLIVVDFLATLFVTFCIGVASALALAACVMLMAGEAHGAAPGKPRPVQGAKAAPATTADLLLAHYFAARYAGLIAVDRFYPAEPSAVLNPDQPKGCRG
ncbi:MAG TPA: hypothetical protein VLV56_10715 [Burkholderiales bacterium]|nr:hypothetical protein [Burkholderiales bacterium]